MARKMRSRRPRTGLSKAQAKAVKKIARKVVDEEIEDKAGVITAENEQLYHNKPYYVGKIIGGIVNDQGVEDGDQSSGGSGPTKIRVGDEISLKNINIRFWLSNKLDRPNVIYKGVLYWYPVGTTPGDADVYKTQSNKMLDRYNDKVIKVVDTFIVRPGNMFLNGTEKFEHSYLATLNKSYRNKKIKFDNNGSVIKGFELGFTVACYDAYGTIQTDNIASMAYNMQLTYQDA